MSQVRDPLRILHPVHPRGVWREPLSCWNKASCGIARNNRTATGCCTLSRYYWHDGKEYHVLPVSRNPPESLLNLLAWWHGFSCFRFCWQLSSAFCRCSEHYFRGKLFVHLQRTQRFAVFFTQELDLLSALPASYSRQSISKTPDRDISQRCQNRFGNFSVPWGWSSYIS